MSNKIVPAPQSAIDILQKLVIGLNFRSESDDIWTIFVPTARRAGAVTCLQMQKLTGRSGCQMDSPRDFDQFMQHAIDVQDQKQQYQDLYKAMSDLLTERRVFRMSGIGHFNLGYFVVGIDSLNNLVGVSVGATET